MPLLALELLGAAPAAAAMSTAAILGLLLNVGFLVVLIWALVVVIKLPEKIDRATSLLNQAHGTQREILAEIRSVTRAE